MDVLCEDAVHLVNAASLRNPVISIECLRNWEGEILRFRPF